MKTKNNNNAFNKTKYFAWNRCDAKKWADEEEKRLKYATKRKGRLKYIELEMDLKLSLQKRKIYEFFYQCLCQSNLNDDPCLPW